MRKEILRVFASKDEETGKVYAEWIYPENCKAFTLKGILCSIIDELNQQEKEESYEEFEE